MSATTVRKLQPSDMDQIQELMATRDGYTPKLAQIRRDVHAWIAFDNPFADNGEATYYVVEKEGRVIAYHGRMPTMFNMKGTAHKAYYVHDLYVHPEIRDAGKGFWLTMSLAKKIEDDCDSCFCLFGMTPLNYEMQKRRGYEEVEVESHIKVIDPREALSQFLSNHLVISVLSPIMKLGLKILDRIVLGMKRSNVSVTQIDRFDEKCDALYERISPRLGISTVRNARFLNWRYADRPHKNDFIFAAEKDGEFSGYIVVGFNTFKGFPVADIKDILADPDDEDTLTALILKAVTFLKHFRICSIRCFLMEDQYISVLKKFLFLRIPEKKPMLIGHVSKFGADGGNLTDVRNWHFMVGESDIYMFNQTATPGKVKNEA